MTIFDSYWENFKSNGKYNGEEFENLIEEILTIMYGRRWKRTSKTHDGNRDFFLNMNNETLWAECKNYENSISLKTLSPTLVMAQVCDANTVLFFSRSEINHFAKEKIITYGYKTNKKIMFYDGKLLEKCLIQTNHKLPSKYKLPPEIIFDYKNSDTFLQVSEFFFSALLSKMLVSEDDYMDYRVAKCLHYNEPFSLLITISNNHIMNCAVEVSFSEDNIDKVYYEYFDKNISPESNVIRKITLKPGESIAVPICLRPIKFKKELYLPKFDVKYISELGQTQEWNSVSTKLACKWVGMTKLQGSHYNLIINKIDDILTNNVEFSALLLTGGSGTGKTRILKEACCSLHKNGYKILELNVSEEHSVTNLIKEIIYFLYEVPAELVTQVIEERVYGEVYDDLDSKSNLFVRISRMINSLTDDIELFMNQYMELLFIELSKKKIAIIIDNMQFAGLDFQKFWENYIDYAVNQCHTNKTILMTSVNLDYMSKESAKFIYTIQNSNIKYYVNEIIDGFKDTNQAILYLRELMHIDNSEYDDLFKQIIENVSLKPFNLYQMVKYLEESELIKHSKNMQGYILTPEATFKTAWYIPKDINEVLKHRFHFATTHLGKDVIELIMSSCYLFENIDSSIIEILNIDEKALVFLLDHQIISKDEKGYHFVHDITRKYYEQYWTQNLLYCLYKIEDMNKLLYYGDVYKIYKICVVKDDTFIIKVCKEQNLSNVSIRLQGVFLDNLFTQCFENNVIKEDVPFWLGTFAWICDNARNIMGSEKALVYHQKVFAYLDNLYEDFSSICCNELRRLLHSHCDIYIQMHQRPKAISFAKSVINKLSNKPLQNANEDEYYVLKAIMYNRIFCAYNNAFPTEEIKLERNEAIKKSREQILFIQNETKRNLIDYLNNSDDGYRFFGLKTNYNELMQIWSKCLVDVPHLAPEKTMNYYRKQIQCHLIKQDNLGVREYISKGRMYLSNGKYSHEPLIFNTFFIMAEIVNNLQEAPKEMYYYTENLLDKLVKLQLLLKSNKLADIYLLKGINAYYKNDVQTVYHAFKQAYLAYNENETSYYWIKRQLMQENIITAYSILKISNNNYDISFLSQSCKNKIPQFSKQKFEASGIIQTKDKLFNLPLVV